MTVVKAQVKGNDRVVSVNYDFGANLAEAVAKFGEDVVFNKAVGALTIDVQTIIRRGIIGTPATDTKPAVTYTDEQIQAKVDEWKPGVVVRTHKDPKVQVAELLAKLSPEERKAYLAELLG